MKIARLALAVLIFLTACDRDGTQTPPLDPPRLERLTGSRS